MSIVGNQIWWNNFQNYIVYGKAIIKLTALQEAWYLKIGDNNINKSNPCSSLRNKAETHNDILWVQEGAKHRRPFGLQRAMRGARNVKIFAWVTHSTSLGLGVMTSAHPP